MGFSLTLVRRQKKRCAVAAEKLIAASMIGGGGACAISIVESEPFTSTLNYGVLTANGVA
jgi:hypothetical protein